MSRKSRCLLIEVSLGPVLINDITRVLERVARVAERDRIREAIRKISIVSGRGYGGKVIGTGYEMLDPSSHLNR